MTEQDKQKSVSRIATAGMVDLPDGRRIWLPPTGRPFWAHLNPARDLTDEELTYFGSIVPAEHR